MTPPDPQVPPARPTISQISWGRPPAATFIFWSIPLAEKPTHRPSGDQKGISAFSVPGRAVAVPESIERNHSIRFPSLPLPTNTIRRPSGESAKGATPPANFTPSGGVISNWLSGCSVAGLKIQPTVAPEIRMTTPAAAHIHFRRAAVALAGTRAAPAGLSSTSAITSPI